MVGGMANQSGFYHGWVLSVASIGNGSSPNLSAQGMVAAGNTPVYPAGFMVAVSYYNSNHKEGLAVQFPDVTAHTDYHRLVSSRVTWS